MTEITKEEWIRRCQQRYIDQSGIDAETAEHFAEACWESYREDGYSPEDSADEDMSYWDNDE